MIEDHFGEDVAATYDQDVAADVANSQLAAMVSFLAALGPRSALELGIGTGRVALPLRERGIDVEGVDLSTAMVERMRAKPGGDEVRVSFGDFATTTMDRQYDLVYLVFNTIMNLTSQAGQVACVANAAAHLMPGGLFVIEVMIPDLRRLPPGEVLRTFSARADALGFDEYDVANQGLVSHHYRAKGDSFEHHAVPFRYVWPSELDLMATMAGMRLRERWSDWTRAPFTSDSTQHVSVWEKST